MCKRAYEVVRHACLHQHETPGSLIPDNGCDNCGVEKGRNNDIASKTTQFPCDDCKAQGLWAQTAGGKWYKVATGGPKQFTPDYKFPCQFSL